MKLLSFLMKISKIVVLFVLKSNNDEPFIIFPITVYPIHKDFVKIVWLKQKVIMVYSIKLFNSFPLNKNK